MSHAKARHWGFWTQAKLAILGEYLPAFLAASSRAKETIYIDAFAGQGTGVNRDTGDQFLGSARIALNASGPSGGFTKLRYIELSSRAASLEGELKAEYPARDIKVYEGDCNTKLAEVLKDLEPFKWAPTFAFIDPDGMEFEWATLRALADHKRGYRSVTSKKPEYKVEVWILFAAQGLIRTLAHNPAKLRPEDEQRASRVYGSDDWRHIFKSRLDGTLDPSEAREEYVNLMRWRMENELGYARTHAFELKNTRGGSVYHMVFATDNAAGDNIMADLYLKASRVVPGMRKEAKDHQSGQISLELDGVEFDEPTYEWERPWTPPGIELGDDSDTHLG